jgi:hypothetical protein
MATGKVRAANLAVAFLLFFSLGSVFSTAANLDLDANVYAYDVYEKVWPGIDVYVNGTLNTTVDGNATLSLDDGDYEIQFNDSSGQYYNSTTHVVTLVGGSVQTYYDDGETGTPTGNNWTNAGDDSVNYTSGASYDASVAITGDAAIDFASMGFTSFPFTVTFQFSLENIGGPGTYFWFTDDTDFAGMVYEGDVRPYATPGYLGGDVDPCQTGACAGFSNWSTMEVTMTSPTTLKVVFDGMTLFDGSTGTSFTPTKFKFYSSAGFYRWDEFEVTSGSAGGSVLSVNTTYVIQNVTDFGGRNTYSNQTYDSHSITGGPTGMMYETYYVPAYDQVLTELEFRQCDSATHEYITVVRDPALANETQLLNYTVPGNSFANQVLSKPVFLRANETYAFQSWQYSAGTYCSLADADDVIIPTGTLKNGQGRRSPGSTTVAEMLENLTVLLLHEGVTHNVLDQYTVFLWQKDVEVLSTNISIKGTSLFYNVSNVVDGMNYTYEDSYIASSLSLPSNIVPNTGLYPEITNNVSFDESSCGIAGTINYTVTLSNGTLVYEDETTDDCGFAVDNVVFEQVWEAHGKANETITVNASDGYVVSSTTGGLFDIGSQYGLLVGCAFDVLEGEFVGETNVFNVYDENMTYIMSPAGACNVTQEFYNGTYYVEFASPGYIQSVLRQVNVTRNVFNDWTLFETAKTLSTVLVSSTHDSLHWPYADGENLSIDIELFGYPSETLSIDVRSNLTTNGSLINVSECGKRFFDNAENGTPSSHNWTDAGDDAMQYQAGTSYDASAAIAGDGFVPITVLENQTFPIAVQMNVSVGAISGDGTYIWFRSPGTAQVFGIVLESGSFRPFDFGYLGGDLYCGDYLDADICPTETGFFPLEIALTSLTTGYIKIGNATLFNGTFNYPLSSVESIVMYSGAGYWRADDFLLTADSNYCVPIVSGGGGINITAFINGESTATASYPEVGLIPGPNTMNVTIQAVTDGVLHQYSLLTDVNVTRIVPATNITPDGLQTTRAVTSGFDGYGCGFADVTYKVYSENDALLLNQTTEAAQCGVTTQYSLAGLLAGIDQVTNLVVETSDGLVAVNATGNDLNVSLPLNVTVSCPTTTYPEEATDTSFLATATVLSELTGTPVFTGTVGNLTVNQTSGGVFNATVHYYTPAASYAADVNVTLGGKTASASDVCGVGELAAYRFVGPAYLSITTAVPATDHPVGGLTMNNTGNAHLGLGIKATDIVGSDLTLHANKFKVSGTPLVHNVSVATGNLTVQNVLSRNFTMNVPSNYVVGGKVVIGTSATARWYVVVQ